MEIDNNDNNNNHLHRTSHRETHYIGHHIGRHRPHLIKLDNILVFDYRRQPCIDADEPRYRTNVCYAMLSITYWCSTTPRTRTTTAFLGHEQLSQIYVMLFGDNIKTRINRGFVAFLGVVMLSGTPPPYV